MGQTLEHRAARHQSSMSQQPARRPAISGICSRLPCRSPLKSVIAGTELFFCQLDLWPHESWCLLQALCSDPVDSLGASAIPSEPVSRRVGELAEESSHQRANRPLESTWDLK